MVWSWVLGTGCASGPPPARRVLPPAELAGPSGLRTLVEQLADPALRGRDEGSEGSAAARRLLVGQLEACGVRPAGEDGYLQRIATGAGTNVLGRIPATSDDPQIVVLSAHYDHQDPGWRVHPGAQDNAAAVAVLVRLGCALAASPLPREVVIALWDAEEPPTFLTDAMGSRYWHAHPTVPLDRVGAVVVLDLLGGGMWDGYDGTFALGGETASAVRDAVASAREPELSVLPASLSVVEDLVIGKRAVWSDYEVFRDHAVPVLFVTDGQNERYHTPADTVDALDLDKLAAEGRWLRQVAGTLASGPSIRWAPAADREQDRRSVAAALGAALAGPRAWGQATRDALRSARDAVGDPDASPRDVRAAAQRLMCWSGPQASLFTCSLF